jgi:hypothetical protein
MKGGLGRALCRRRQMGRQNWTRRVTLGRATRVIAGLQGFQGVPAKLARLLLYPHQAQINRGTNMNFDDVIISNNTTSSDFTLLEGLYQLAVTGHTDDWEFERLNNAVYERLLSSYNAVDMGALDQSANPMA